MRGAGDGTIAICINCGGVEGNHFSWCPNQAGQAVEAPRLAKAPDMLRAAADIYDERKQSYGDNYLHVGKVLAGLFPHGIHIEPRDEEELNRLHLIMHMISKLSRYCENSSRGGHADSLDDLAVYAMICQEVDNRYQAKKRLVVDGKVVKP